MFCFQLIFSECMCVRLLCVSIGYCPDYMSLYPDCWWTDHHVVYYQIYCSSCWLWLVYIWLVCYVCYFVIYTVNFFMLPTKIAVLHCHVFAYKTVHVYTSLEYVWYLIGRTKICLSELITWLMFLEFLTSVDFL
jgi:hypothetical protein